MDIQLVSKSKDRWIFLSEETRHVNNRHELLFAFETVKFDRAMDCNITLSKRVVRAEKFSEHYTQLLNDGWTVCNPHR